MYTRLKKIDHVCDTFAHTHRTIAIRFLQTNKKEQVIQRNDKRRKFHSQWEEKWPWTVFSIYLSLVLFSLSFIGEETNVDCSDKHVLCLLPVHVVYQVVEYTVEMLLVCIVDCLQMVVANWKPPMTDMKAHQRIQYHNHRNQSDEVKTVLLYYATQSIQL